MRARSTGSSGEANGNLSMMTQDNAPPLTRQTPYASQSQPKQQFDRSPRPIQRQTPVAQTDPVPEKAVSLNELKTPPKIISKIKKEPSKENRDELRNALASVMKDSTLEKRDPEKKESKKDLSAEAKAKAEIPEDVLKKMLDVGEEDKKL